MLRANEKKQSKMRRGLRGNAAVFKTLWNVRRLWHHLRQVVGKDIITLLHATVILYLLANVVWSTCTLSRSQTSSRVAKTIPEIKHNA